MKTFKEIITEQPLSNSTTKLEKTILSNLKDLLLRLEKEKEAQEGLVSKKFVMDKINKYEEAYSAVFIASTKLDIKKYKI